MDVSTNIPLQCQDRGVKAFSIRKSMIGNQQVCKRVTDPDLLEIVIAQQMRSGRC